MAVDDKNMSPLAAAMGIDHVQVLRILLDHRMDAVDSTESIAIAVGGAVRNVRATHLDVLLSHFDGDDDTQRMLLDKATKKDGLSR